MGWNKKPINKIKMTCQVCGKDVFKWPCHVKKIKKFIVCSSKCRQVAMIGFNYKGDSNKILKKCKECKKEFHVWPYIVKKGCGHFCSEKCRKVRAGDKLKGKRKKENKILHFDTHCEMIIKSKRKTFRILFDKIDFELINKYTWSMSGNGYASTSNRGGYKGTLHRFIMNTPTSMDTDHKNGDVFGNRRYNLRICTTAQNLANRNPEKGKKYKGVNKTPHNTYHVAVAGKHVGSFKTEKEAAIAYNIKAKEVFGEFARLNII